jgi:hypothetical protein
MPGILQSEVIFRQGKKYYCIKCAKKLNLIKDFKNVIYKNDPFESAEPMLYYCDDCGVLIDETE